MTPDRPSVSVVSLCIFKDVRSVAGVTGTAAVSHGGVREVTFLAQNWGPVFPGRGPVCDVLRPGCGVFNSCNYMNDVAAVAAGAASPAWALQGSSFWLRMSGRVHIERCRTRR